MTSHDSDKASAFAGRMTSMLNDGFLAMMSSIGHQTGLFDAMSGRSPSTSDELAEAAGLNERYVREWLGAMVTGRIVDYDPASRTYHLPTEHAAALTRAAGTDNIAAMLQWVGVMASVEPKIIDCFQNGGGLPYSEYERFHAIMADSNARVFDHTLVQTTLPLVPGIAERLNAGIEVLDVGCGSGHAVNVMAAAYPKSCFVGYDFSAEGVEAGRAEAAHWGLENARFEVRDVAQASGGPEFDFITSFDSIHDQAQPAAVLARIFESLRDDGTYLMVDVAASSHLEENVGHPMGPFLYSISVMHCMSVSLGLDGDGLGTVWGEQKALEMLAEAGFEQVDVKQVEGDVTNNYYIAVKR
ncbi:MAG: class I SAM-dependent methyltransferase [Myxococcota bacterium]|nr:class I SAM-dependent methyltransferase [Myxococcota bacterium]